MNESTHELAPRPRLVGPGRREREYLARIDELRRDGIEKGERAKGLERELETAQCIERGTQRLVDRLESALASESQRAATAETGQKQLLLALGAVQRENELLRERVSALTALAEPRRASWWRRLLPGRA